MPEHTAPPYEHAGSGHIRAFTPNRDEFTIAHCAADPWAPSSTPSANAEFIVRACNAHDTLMDAVELIARGGIIEPGVAKLLLIELGLEAAG